VIGRGTIVLSVAAGLGLGLWIATRAPGDGSESAPEPAPIHQPGQLYLRLFDAPQRSIDFDSTQPAAVPGLCVSENPRESRLPAPPAPPPRCALPKVRIELLATPPPPA